MMMAMKALMKVNATIAVVKATSLAIVLIPVIPRTQGPQFEKLQQTTENNPSSERVLLRQCRTHL